MRSGIIENEQDLKFLIDLILNEAPLKICSSKLTEKINNLVKFMRKLSSLILKSSFEDLRKRILCSYCLRETPIFFFKCKHQYCFSCSFDFIGSISSSSKFKCLINGCSQMFPIKKLSPLLSQKESLNYPQYSKLFFLINRHLKTPNCIEDPAFIENPELPCSYCGSKYPLYSLTYPCPQHPFCRPCLLKTLSQMSCLACNLPISIQTISNLLN